MLRAVVTVAAAAVPFAAAQGSTPNAADFDVNGCFTGSFDPNLDFFPNKVESTQGEFDVTYENSFKRVSTTNGGSYIAYQCGTPEPDTEGFDGELVEIPIRSYGSNTQTLLPFFQILGVADDFLFYTSDANLPSCLNPNLVIPDCDFNATCSAVAWAGMEDPVKAVFLDFGDIEKPAATGFSKIIVPASSSPDLLSVAEWIKFVGLFFNKEKEANSYFKLQQADLECLEAAGDFDEGEARARRVLRQETSKQGKLLSMSEIEQIAAGNVNLRRHLMTEKFYEPGVVQRTLRADEVTKNVLILPYYGNGFQIGSCDNYYCELSENSDDLVQVIDTNVLGISSGFTVYSVSEVLELIQDKDITIDTVVLLYYLNTPNGEYPGPEDEGKDEFTQLCNGLNTTGQLTAYFLPNTDVWFSYRPGTPQLVQSDFIHMINPGTTVQAILENPLFYFAKFPENADNTGQLPIVNFASTCSNFDTLACLQQTNSPTSSPSTSSPSAPTTDDTDKSAATGVAVSVATVFFAIVAVLAM